MDDSPQETEERSSDWDPPADSDLVGLPLILGLLLAIVVVVAAFLLIGATAGLITVIVVVVAALAIAYRVFIASDTNG